MKNLINLRIYLWIWPNNNKLNKISWNKFEKSTTEIIIYERAWLKKIKIITSKKKRVKLMWRGFT